MNCFKVFISLTIFATMSRPSLAAIKHVKCRGGLYTRSSVPRFPVPDNKVDWSIKYDEYEPQRYSAASLQGKPWADPEIGEKSFKPKWNSLDGNVDRASYVKQYTIRDGFPLNPIGRTGIAGRGVLGRWGPNHAADPVVTRWKMSNNDKELNNVTNKAILQFIAIQRRDTSEWALPGGMVDPGEKVTATAIREFQEEATNSLIMSDEEKSTWKIKFNTFFSEGEEVYRGYVDDPRNTDNAWMETVAYNFHDENGSRVGTLNLHAGDDAVGVRWIDADSSLKLYASHRDIIETVVKRLEAHW